MPVLADMRVMPQALEDTYAMLAVEFTKIEDIS
jgi:hypothetical protein